MDCVFELGDLGGFIDGCEDGFSAVLKIFEVVVPDFSVEGGKFSDFFLEGVVLIRLLLCDCMDALNKSFIECIGFVDLVAGRVRGGCGDRWC